MLCYFSKYWFELKYNIIGSYSIFKIKKSNSYKFNHNRETAGKLAGNDMKTAGKSAVIPAEFPKET